MPIEVRTKPGRHYPFLSRHPWVLASALHPLPPRDSSPTQDAIEDVPPDAEGGEETPPPSPAIDPQVVDLLDHDGNWIARGLLNRSSKLRVRLYTFDRSEAIDETLLGRRVEQAIARRRFQTPPADAGERLIFSESDLLSGLIVDRYSDCLSVQFTAAALLPFARFLVDRVVEQLAESGIAIRRVVARVDETTRKHEGLSEKSLAVLEQINAEHGQGDDSSAEDAWVWYRHNDLTLAIDLTHGQKTGGYLDQQANHRVASRYLASSSQRLASSGGPHRVLDVCTYTGGFALAAARAGVPEVVAVDSSQKFLDIAAENARRNELTGIQFEKADCFDYLKQLTEQDEKFSGIVLDPPRFAGSRRAVDSALRAYGRLNQWAMDCLPSGGILVTCSCSGHVSRADFLNMLVESARRRDRDLIVLESRGPSPDHPFSVACPESNYLKCIIAQVI